jgi:hypothetical protein
LLLMIVAIGDLIDKFKCSLLGNYPTDSCDQE